MAWKPRSVVISAVIFVFVLVGAYRVFPQLEPTVVGYVGHKLEAVISSEKIPKPDEVRQMIPQAVKKLGKKDTPAQPKAPDPPEAPPPVPPKSP